MYMMRNLGVPIAKIPAPGEPPSRDILPPTHGPGGYGGLITWIHESRLIVFPGIAVSRRARVQMRGWGDSIFTRVDDVLQKYDQTWGGVANLMTDFAQGVLSMEGLSQSIMANNKASTQVVANRAIAVNMGRSIARMMLIDAKEKFERVTTPLSGLPEILEQFALRLAAASGMPLSLLMGQVQGGLGDASAGDIRYFYDQVAAKQERSMMPQVKRLLRLMMIAKNGPTDGELPERWTARARPLYQLSATERADCYLKVAQADQIYMANSVVSAEEVAATRFAGSDYNDGPIMLDLDGREEMSAQDEKDKAAREKAMLASAKQAQQQSQQQQQANQASPNGQNGKHATTPKNGAGEASKSDDAQSDVYKMLSGDFPAAAITWIEHAKWTGPVEVDTKDIDYVDDSRWRASAQPNQIEMFKDKIAEGFRKPVVLGRTHGSNKWTVLDGHHRSLSYRELGMPALAYCAFFENDAAFNLAQQMHSKQESHHGPQNAAPSV
jgi:hypothetical protein